MDNQIFCTIIRNKRWTKFTQFAEACKIDYYHLKGMRFTDSSIIDNGMPQEGRYSGVLFVVDFLHRWEKLSEVKYGERKYLAAGILVDRLKSVMPGVNGEIEGYDIVTPRNIYLQTKNHAGTPYGFAQIPNQLGLHRMGNASPVKGLYFASAWSRPGAAYVGTICSGYACAKRVLREAI